jgi:hypothetical protein
LSDLLESVYNFAVEGDYCFRVGQKELLVHKASVGDKPCPPITATMCDPEVTSASPTHFELLNHAKPDNFIEGILVSGGELQFLIENLPKTQPTTGCPGYWMFQQMLDHFGASVLAIKGT